MNADHAATREFFATKAATWDERFPDDGPAFAAAAARLGLSPGGLALDAGCGTGRALATLREAAGRVIGVDLTPEMVAEAAAKGTGAALLVADASRLPLAGGSCDGVLASGLIGHVPSPAALLAELARVTAPGGRLALFHPIGRERLAARKGHALRPDDVRAEPNLRPLLGAAGWDLALYDDGPDRYLAVGVRR